MMLHYVTVNTVALIAALERQDLSRTYLAHHELESVVIIVMLYQRSLACKAHFQANKCVTPWRQ